MEAGGIEGNEEPETFQRQALEIQEPGKDFDPNAKPKDGVEYLTHMLYERRQQPVVMVRPLRSPELPVSTSVLPDDAVFKLLTEDGELIVKFRQTKEWKDKIVAEFLQVREHFEIARKINQQKRMRLDEEELKVPTRNYPRLWIKFCRKTNPLVNIIVGWSQKRMEMLLGIFGEWLRKQYEDKDAADAESDEEDNVSVGGGTGDEDTQCAADSAAPTIDNNDGGDVEKGAQDETKAEKAKEEAEQDVAIALPIIVEDEAGACGGAPAAIIIEDVSDDENEAIDDDEECEGAVGLPLPNDQRYLDLQNVDVWFGLWVYALLIGIDLRLSSDMLSTIRQIARFLILFRHRISPEEKDEHQPYDMIITLIAKVFGQLDFEAFV